MIYKIDGTPLSSFGAIPSPKNSYFALSGMLDLPKRIGATEYDWGTEIEPFVEQEDIELDGRTIALNVVIKKAQLQAFKEACVACRELSFDHDNFAVIQKDEITVEDLLDYCSVRVPFWQNEFELKPVSVVPSGSGEYTIDDYSIVKDFGIYVGKSASLENVSKRIDLPITEFYYKSQYRGVRSIDLSCTMRGANFADIYSKINQFQSVLMAPGLRTLKIRDNTLSVYFKDGMKVDILNENISQFNLMATVV